MVEAYLRELEDGSGFVVCEGTREKNMLPATGSIAARDRWEKVLGLGGTPEEAWKDFRNRSR
jgi:hypothetical protein